MAQPDPPPHNQELPGEGPEELSLFGEFVWYLRQNRKWWMIPLILVFLLLSLLVLVAPTPLAPFVYSFF